MISRRMASPARAAGEPGNTPSTSSPCGFGSTSTPIPPNCGFVVSLVNVRYAARRK